MKLKRTTSGCDLIAVLFIPTVIAAEVISYEFGDTCSVFLKELDENRRIYVEYYGKRVGSFCDDYSFEGVGNENMDEYKICVTPQFFNDPDCAVELKYTSTIFGSTIQTVTCSENYNTKFCGSSDDNLYIHFKTRDGKDTSNASFKLHITAEKSFDYGNFVGAIVGGVIGGIVLITIVTGIVIYCVCRRKPTQGQVLGTAQNTSGQTTNQPGIPYATYSPQQSNTTTLYPTGNYPTQYPAGYSTQQPFLPPQTNGTQQ
ncbi:uncharacterized protein LOC134240677 [Saccostrea cucullata]|uniref:uncharacterized protein LOC134240677 n=1 Tax=Saccostrea cuccullata TaxID=36930 RepID=UPI002ED06EC9